MGILDLGAESAFFTASTGERIFRPLDPRIPGRVIPDAATERRIRRRYALYRWGFVPVYVLAFSVAALPGESPAPLRRFLAMIVLATIGGLVYQALGKRYFESLVRGFHPDPRSEEERSRDRYRQVGWRGLAVGLFFLGTMTLVSAVDVLTGGFEPLPLLMLLGSLALTVYFVHLTRGKLRLEDEIEDRGER